MFLPFLRIIHSKGTLPLCIIPFGYLYLPDNNSHRIENQVATYEIYHRFKVNVYHLAKCISPTRKILCAPLLETPLNFRAFVERTLAMDFHHVHELLCSIELLRARDPKSTHKLAVYDPITSKILFNNVDLVEM